MPKITMVEQPEFLILPANSILLTKVEDTTIRDVENDRGSWQKLELKFKILGVQVSGDGSPVDKWEELISSPIWGSVPFRLSDSPDNRLRQWVEAIYDMPLAVGFELDTDLLEGRTVRAVTSTYERRKFIDPKTGKPSLQHQVESLLPARSGTSAPAAPAAPATQAWTSHQAVPAGLVTTSEPNWDEEPPF